MKRQRVLKLFDRPTSLQGTVKLVIPSEVTPFFRVEDPPTGGYDSGKPLWTQKAFDSFYPRCGYCGCQFPATNAVGEVLGKPAMRLCGGHEYHLRVRLGFNVWSGGVSFDFPAEP